MFKPQYILLWVSGLCFGLAVCAYFSCPHWKIAVPVMLLLTFAAARVGFEQKKKREQGEG